jgi:O-antigen/teichoic acid export membrane protein
VRTVKKVFKNKVVKNFSYLTIGSVLSQLLLLITVIKITNVFSPDQYGVYTFIISQGMLLHAISDLGIKAVIIRAIARNPERTNDLVINGLKIRLFAVLVLMGGYVLYNYQLGSLLGVHLFLLGLYTLTNSVFHIFEYVFLGNQKMLFPSIVKVVHSISWFGVVFLLPVSFFTVNILLGIFIFLNILQVIAFFILLKKYDFLIGNVENIWTSSRSLVEECWPYFALMLLTLPTNHLANNFLDINSSSEEVGFFNLAKKLMSPVSLIITFALTALFPNLAAMFEIDKAKFNRMIAEGLGLFIGVTSFFSFLFTMFSKEAVLWFFPSDYLPAVKVIQLQIWYIMLNGINHLITIIYGAVNMEKKIFKLALMSALFSTPLLFLGSYYGAFGISIAFVGSFAIYEFYYWNQFKKNIGIPIRNEKIAWLLTFGLFCFSYFISDQIGLHFKILSVFPILFLIFRIYKTDLLKIIPR